MTKGRPTVMRVARERAGMTQGELGRRLGCSQPVVSDWERGLAVVPARRRRELAGILEVPIGALLMAWDDWLLENSGRI